MTARPLWADLHNHNAVGYGRGAMERSYRIARGCLLDAYCFTPHGVWHDLPADDAKMADFHRVGFARVREQFADVAAAADAEYEPGRFVTFHGFEWHSSGFGDYHTLFPAAVDGPYAGESLNGLAEFVRSRGGLMIPHHVGYRVGWRGANWEAFARMRTGDPSGPTVAPVVDVFSEHGCAMEAEFNMPMLLHSMGGVERSQTMMARLGRGLVAGVLASTDNHFGHPASYGEGLAGIWAEQRTRESVLDAIRRRHTFAVTGDRIVPTLFLGEAMMGDVLGPGSAAGPGPKTLRFSADCLGLIDYVRIVRNGRPVHTVSPPPDADPTRDREFVVRLEFGWDAMTSREVTDWRIGVRVSDGRVMDVCPCFAGGSGSVEKLNAVEPDGEAEVALTAFTSRANARPTGGVAMRLAGDPATRIDVHVGADHGGRRCACELSATVGELLERDAWAAISPIFSSPKIRLGQACGVSQTRLAGEWTDPAPATGDWYLLKVQQANGHAAWTSPIWRRGPV